MDMPQTLALFSFRSKQEYIYRTNRMKEITGASELMGGISKDFLDIITGDQSGDVVVEGAENPLRVDREWFESKDGQRKAKPWKWDELKGYDAAIVFQGGSDLCLVFQREKDFQMAARVYSQLVLRRAYGLELLCASTQVDASSSDWSAAWKDLYAKLDRAKRTAPFMTPVNVLPYTQVDRLTFQPISFEGKIGDDTLEASRENECKRNRYESLPEADREQGKFLDELVDDKGTEDHAGDSLIAIMYCDGNSMGARREKLQGIDELRSFSVDINTNLVDRTVECIKKALEEGFPGEDEKSRRRRSFRSVIGDGDEINLVMNAHAVPVAVDAYFKALKEVEGADYKACCGVAICHAHDPFAQVYRIADECCESGKNRNRKAPADDNGCYVDFHFCRSGITGSLEQIRGAQEQDVTARPYRVDRIKNQERSEYEVFMAVGNALGKSLARSDIKSLGAAVLSAGGSARGSRYRLELERCRAKMGAKKFDELVKMAADADLDFAKLLFDISGFYDVWFAESAAKEQGGADDGE